MLMARMMKKILIIMKDDEENVHAAATDDDEERDEVDDIDDRDVDFENSGLCPDSGNNDKDGWGFRHNFRVIRLS